MEATQNISLYEEMEVEENRNYAVPSSDVHTERFGMKYNECYGSPSTPTRRSERKENDGEVNAIKLKNGELAHPNGDRKIVIVLFVIVFALLLGTAGVCVAFALQITTLKSEIASQMELVHKLNSSDNMLYQQLSQQNASLDSSYQQLRQELNSSTQLLFDSLLERPPGQYPFYPAVSCAALPPFSPSGYYWVRASNGSAVSVYCDMTRSCGGVTGGWMRVAELDMTNSNHQCPSGLMERNDSGKRTCVRIETTGGCSSINNFITPGVDYSSVCGRVIGYQYGEPEAFYNRSINSIYVDGVSLTHGNPRQHIWTFATSRDEVGTLPSTNCPCTNTNQAAQATPPPAFVGNDYFCDTGSEDRSQLIFYGDDPLWDGAGCGPLNTCCSFNTPPWFYKQLPQPTTDDIEMRVCTIGDPIDNEEVAIEIVEMYVR